MRNEKYVVPEALLRAQKEKLEWIDVVQSPRFQKIITETVNAILDAHNRRRRADIRIFYDETSDFTAATDDFRIMVNAGNDLIINDENKNRVSIEESAARFMGIVFHEVGHILYTCFSETEKMVRLFSNGDLIVADVDPEMKDSYNELQELLKNEKMYAISSSPVPLKDFILQLYLMLNNSIEDGREERKLLENDARFSGFEAGLRRLRDAQKKSCATWDFTEQNIVSFANLSLLYAKYGMAGTYTGGFEEFENAKPVINQMLETNEARTFAEYNLQIILCIWPKIKALVQEIENKHKGSSNEGAGKPSSASGSPGSSSSGGSSAENSGGSSGGSSEGSGSSGKNESSEGNSSSGKNESSEGNSSSGKSESSEENDPSEESKSSEGNDPSEENESSEENGSSEETSDEEESDENSSAEEEVKETLEQILEQIRKNLPEEKSSINDESETEEKQSDAKTGGSSGTNGDANVSSTIEQIKKELAEQQVRDEAEEAARENLLSEAGRGFAEYHGISVMSMSPACGAQSTIRDVEKMSGPAIKKASAEIRRHLERDMRTGTSKKKVYGKKFRAQNLVNRDFRYFENKATKKDVPKIKVGLLVDESGSMSSNRKYYFARAAAITLYELFEQIPNLDIAIYGHSTNGSVEIYNYTDFGIKQKDVKERLCNITARGGNIDIVPFTALAENLLKQDAEERIMFVVTDGLPYSYVRDMSPEEELSIAADKYTRKGIDIIVASIGNDEERLRNIYTKQRFLDISDPSELPKKVVQVIKRKM